MGEVSRDQTLCIGRIVHYVSFGSAGGQYPSVCRAAVVTEVGLNADPLGANEDANLAVLNPTGLFFNVAAHDENRTRGTWHWPCGA